MFPDFTAALGSEYNIKLLPTIMPKDYCICFELNCFYDTYKVFWTHKNIPKYGQQRHNTFLISFFSMYWISVF